MSRVEAKCSNCHDYVTWCDCGGGATKLEERKGVLDKLSNLAVEQIKKSAYPSPLTHNKKEPMKIEDLKPRDRLWVDEKGKEKLDKLMDKKWSKLISKYPQWNMYYMDEAHELLDWYEQRLAYLTKIDL